MTLNNLNRYWVEVDAYNNGVPYQWRHEVRASNPRVAINRAMRLSRRPNVERMRFGAVRWSELPQRPVRDD